jgi:hypothetical protein
LNYKTKPQFIIDHNLRRFAMTQNLINSFSLVALVVLIAAPAMVSLIVQVQPTTLNDTAIASLPALKAGDVVGFNLVGIITGAGDSGVTGVKGSLTQLLATITPGTWNTQVIGTLFALTLAPEFTYGKLRRPGKINADMNDDSFTLDSGSTVYATTDYVISHHFSLIGHGQSGDVLGTSTYSVTDINPASTITTLLNWKFATTGATA